MEKIQLLSEIWRSIPQPITNQIQLNHRELIDKYLETFNIGECFYVIFNTKTAEMEYVSSGVKTVLGISNEEFTLSYVLENIDKADSPYYYHYEESAVRFFMQLDPKDLFNYKFSYDYRIRSAIGEEKRLIQTIIPVFFFESGGARTLGVFTDITHLQVSGIPKLSFIGMNGAPSFYNIHLTQDFQINLSPFSKREREILGYILAGKTTEEIAQLLFRSPFTIQNHRKNILVKSGCKNLKELLVKTIREGWI